MAERSARLVEQWRTLHHDELHANWLLAQEPAALSGIEPLHSRVLMTALARVTDVLHGDDAPASVVQPLVVREYRLQQTS